MNWLAIAVALCVGFALGLLAALVLRWIQARTARELAEELFRESEGQRRASVQAVIENVKASFGSMSLDALSKSTEQFLKLAKERLESEREAGAKELEQKKGLIDQQLKMMTAELEKARNLMKELEKDRAQKFGELARQLQTSTQQTAALVQTTNSLREALSSSRSRGQWGERMAEDVLKLAGFVENVNYLKQKTIEGGRGRPDFTFLLPRDLKLNMDVKFPLDNYMKFLDAESDADREKTRGDFLRDVRSRVKEVASREYIDPEQGTVDCVLLFIPNEQIYSFIHEQDSAILDEGIRNRVIFCSPITLFAVLCVIRQAVDNFAIEQTSSEILALLGSFKKQWNLFLGKMDSLGKRLDDAQKEYEALVTTRRRQLDRPLDRLESLRAERGLPSAADEGALSASESGGPDVADEDDG